MTRLDLASVSAERVRSSTEAMREVVLEVATRNADVWAAPFPEVVDALVELGRVDLALARLVEGHADAMRILAQAGADARPGVYGVWASRSAGTGVRAVRSGTGWRLTGELRFASGIDLVDRALLPGWVDRDTHLLFDAPVGRFDPDRSTWHTTAMEASRSFTVHADLLCDGADVVGPENFYLERPGFLVGGLGVAAVWAGGARSVLEQVASGLRRFEPSTHQLRRLGVMEQAVWQACTAVDAAAVRLPGLAGEALALETSAARTCVVTACEQVVDEAEHVVGPGGMSTDARLARTLADLAIFVRQHHVDLAHEALGRHALATRETSG